MHIYAINDNEAEIIRKIPFTEKNILTSNIFYEASSDSIVAFSEIIGLQILCMKDETILKDETFRPGEYNHATKLFTKAEGKTVTVYNVSAGNE